MTSHFNDPAYWRARGEEIRTIAEGLKEPDTKQEMLSIADDYDHLAERAEQRLASERKSGLSLL